VQERAGDNGVRVGPPGMTPFPLAHGGGPFPDTLAQNFVTEPQADATRLHELATALREVQRQQAALMERLQVMRPVGGPSGVPRVGTFGAHGTNVTGGIPPLHAAPGTSHDRDASPPDPVGESKPIKALKGALPEKFGGPGKPQVKLSTWLVGMELAFNQNETRDCHKASLALEHLAPPAQQTMRQLVEQFWLGNGGSQAPSWEWFKSTLTNAFPAVTESLSNVQTFLRMRMGDKETLTGFVNRFRAAVALLPAQVPDSLLVPTLVERLPAKYGDQMRDPITRTVYTSSEALYTSLLVHDAQTVNPHVQATSAGAPGSQPTNKRSAPSLGGVDKRQNSADPYHRRMDESAGAMGQGRDLFCKLHGWKNHTTAQCDALKRQAQGAPTRVSRPASVNGRPGSKPSRSDRPQPHVNQVLANVMGASDADLRMALAAREAKRTGPARMQE